MYFVYTAGSDSIADHNLRTEEGKEVHDLLPHGTFRFSMSDFMLGIWMIIFVAVIWAASSVLLQYVFEDMDFKSPFLVTYVGEPCFRNTCRYFTYIYLWDS